MSAWSCHSGNNAPAITIRRMSTRPGRHFWLSKGFERASSKHNRAFHRVMMGSAVCSKVCRLSCSADSCAVMHSKEQSTSSFAGGAYFQCPARRCLPLSLFGLAAQNEGHAGQVLSSPWHYVILKYYGARFGRISGMIEGSLERVQGMP